nr:hypothetical protein [Tanacetum cinerariifolium]
MFQVSTILEDDSVELVSGGANGFVNVALSNSATSSCGSTLVELISEFVALMVGEVLGEEASLPMDVEEETPTVSGGSRVAAERGVDTGRVKAIEYQHCDEEAITNAIFIANLSPVGSLNDDTVEPIYDSDILSDVPH